MNDKNLEAVRLVELAVDDALGELPPDEATELDSLRRGDAAGDALGFEVAAAAVLLARQPALEPLPAALRQRLTDDGNEFFALLQRRRRPAAMPARRWLVPLAAGGWAAAAALVAVLVMNPQLRERVAPTLAQAPSAEMPASRQIAPDPAPPAQVAPAPEVVSPQPRAVATPAEERSRLAAQQFILKRNWSAGGDPTGIGVRGDVIWDGEANRGYLRLVGLRRNDPSFEQYQLWILDASRDERFPVDGGVFDSPNPDAELIVPIVPKLSVGAARAFVITLEPPGGVVVSDRKRVVVIASV